MDYEDRFCKDEGDCCVMPPFSGDGADSKNGALC